MSGRREVVGREAIQSRFDGRSVCGRDERRWKEGKDKLMIRKKAG
jgi:hypothetical protein